jgi:hypothetical protein
MSRQQRIRLDRVAIVDRINHDLQRFRSVGRDAPLRVPLIPADNCAPAVSHRPSWPGIVSQMSRSLGPPVVLDTQEVAGGTNKLSAMADPARQLAVLADLPAP